MPGRGVGGSTCFILLTSSLLHPKLEPEGGQYEGTERGERGQIQVFVGGNDKALITFPPSSQRPAILPTASYLSHHHLSVPRLPVASGT